MSNPFAQNGAIPDRQSKYAPLYVNEFWTGLYTNRNPLREGAVPFLYQKFYSGSRFDSMIAGSNIEISPRLTPIRRYGNSVYNSATFPAINDFYSFRVFDPTSQTESIHVIADTASTVYDATGPSTQTSLFSKAAGAGQTSFQSLGNTLYACDGKNAWKWVWEPGWQSGTYKIGDVVLDTNNNLQKVTSVLVAALSGVATAVTVQSNVVTLIFFQPNFTLKINQHFTMSGVTTATFLNGVDLVASNIIQVSISSVNYWQVTASFNHANYPSAADTGTASSTAAGTSGTTGGGQPTWNVSQYGTTSDSALVWTNIMPSVQKWGIVAPTVAPITSNIPAASALPVWAANTWYWPVGAQFIVDSNNNIQQLTTPGTTGNVVPVWNITVGGTTADNGGGGTAVWTNKGPAARATTHAYSVGDVISVSWSVTTVQGPFGPPPPYGTQYYYYTTYNYNYLFQCVTAGTSSSTATGSIVWSGGINSQVSDGSVVWSNIGQPITRTVSANSSPTISSSTSGGGGGSTSFTTISTVAGNVSNSTLVSTASTITGTTNGISFKVTSAGESGAAEPTWVTAVGKLTTDNGVTWVSQGPSTAANTGTWVYAFAYKNSITGHISSASPSASPVLLAASSWISVSGAGSSDKQVDTIVIYRTTQGVSAPLFELAEISAPQSGSPWSFVDQTPDPPNIGSTLNEFIEADTTGNNAPPPAGINSTNYYLGRMMASSGAFEYYSGVATQPVGIGAESFPALNFFNMPSSVTRSWASATGLLIFTNYGVFYSQGVDGDSNPNTPVLLLEDIGLLSPNCFSVNGSIPAIFTSDKQLLTLDPSSGVSRVSEPIADVLATLSATGAYLTWHTNGTDQAYFIADGSTGWYRLAPTAPPENGLTWSPKATIVGGVKCVQSIETTPGTKTLLLGPTSSGQILKRDLTTNQDNGVSFTANFTIGSLVLAQPNQCAEVASVTTEAKAVGSHPNVSILGDEISGSFEALTTAVNDPPFLNTPSTVYPDRWYFNQLAQPAWMRHLQIQVAWPSENFANELLAFALYGCVHTE